MKGLYIHAAQDLRLSEFPQESLGPGEVRVRISRGGISGPDLHCWRHGGFGTVRLREPMILGHDLCLHATRRAGEMLEKRVLVTGCGPIGALAILAARRAGAADFVATDIAEAPLGFARKLGADLALNTAEAPEALAPYAADKGRFDVQLECSGAPSALAAGIAALRPRGVIVQLGLSGDMSVPMMQVTAKELELRGTFRFHEEFATAVRMMAQGMIDVTPLLTHSFPLQSFGEAFETATDKGRAMKVQLDFAA